MSLCRHYVRELRRSVLVGTPDLEKEESKRSSRALEAIGDIGAGPSMGTEKEREQNAQMSAYLRDQPAPSALHDSPQGSQERRARASTQQSSSTPQGFTSDSNSPAHAVAREDIRASAEKILYTFLLPGAEREITLPGSITSDITIAIEQDGRDDPEVFDVAKDYVFQAMERDAFPGFLRARALGNLIPPTIIARLIVGLIAMFGGFWTAFVLIFLDAPRSTRCWVRFPLSLILQSPWNFTNHLQKEILPFTIGVYCLASYQYSLDPVMALLGLTEYTPFAFVRIREPYVRKLLVKRAITVLTVTILVDAAISLLFILVPGKRL
jgi:hypothetical protein